MAVSGRRLHGAAAKAECRAVSVGAGRHHALPAAGGAAGAKGLSAPAHRHRLEGAGQAAVLAGGMVRPGGAHSAGCGAVFCRVPLPAGLFRQLAGSRLRRRDGRPDPAQSAGSLHPQLSAAKRAVCGAPCPSHQYVPRTGRGGRLARLYDAPPEGAVCWVVLYGASGTGR